jgi:hypothetical protein
MPPCWDKNRWRERQVGATCRATGLVARPVGSTSRGCVADNGPPRSPAQSLVSSSTCECGRNIRRGRRHGPAVMSRGRIGMGRCRASAPGATAPGADGGPPTRTAFEENDGTAVCQMVGLGPTRLQGSGVGSRMRRRMLACGTITYLLSSISTSTLSRRRKRA